MVGSGAAVLVEVECRRSMLKRLWQIIKAQPPTGDPDSWVTQRLFVATMMFATWAIIIVLRLFYLMIPAAAHQMGERAVQSFMLAVVIAAGFFAYEFKRRDEYLYGLIQGCFGISTAMILIFSTSPVQLHLVQWSSLVGAAYVIGRGRSNTQDAKAHPERSPSLRLLAAREARRQAAEVTEVSV